MALTVDRKNTILEKLRTMPANQWRVLDPKDEDQREAIKYIIRNDQLPGWEIEFKDETYSKVQKYEKVILHKIPEQYCLPPYRMEFFWSTKFKFTLL